MGAEFNGIQRRDVYELPIDSIRELIANAVVKLYKKAVVDKPTLGIFLAVALGSYFLNVSPVVFVVLAALAGLYLKEKGGAGK